jgi:CDP-diacylglycerol--glycerol-3-phosphate 3-phosphatidyltransferase
MDKFLTFPNILTLSRLFLIGPIVVSIYEQNISLTLLFGLLAIFSDYLDGFIARKLKQHSSIGKALDPIVDCIIVISVSITLNNVDKLPTWYIALVLARYCIVFVLLLLYYKKTGIKPRSIISGKWSMGIIAMTLCTALFQDQFPLIFQTSLLISVCLLLYSLLDYLHHFRPKA